MPLSDYVNYNDPSLASAATDPNGLQPLILQRSMLPVTADGNVVLLPQPDGQYAVADPTTGRLIPATITDSSKRRAPRKCLICGNHDCRGRGVRTLCPQYDATNAAHQSRAAGRRQSTRPKQTTENALEGTSNDTQLPQASTSTVLGIVPTAADSAIDPTLDSRPLVRSTDVLPNSSAEHTHKRARLEHVQLDRYHDADAISVGSPMFTALA